MRLSASIMAHPSRRRSALDLALALDRDTPIAWDPNPVPSADPAQRWVTCRTAWEAHDPAADWHLVLQDDAIVCQDLLAGLERALEQFSGGGLVSAYTGTGRPSQGSVRRALAYADEHDLAWMSTRSLNWGVAIVVPTYTISGMLSWCSGRRWTRTSREPKNADYRIGVYYRDVLRWRTWYTVPSLVEHGDEPSLVGHDHGPKRVAHRFLGEDQSALDVDWSRVPVGGLMAR